MKPRVLLSCSPNGAVNYENAILCAGGTPVSICFPSVVEEYDGLLLCGGGDIAPSCFHQENRGSKEINALRDESELALISAFLSKNKPIMGICRGHQVLNVSLGGSLIQDISPELHLFHTVEEWEAGDKIHPIRTLSGSLPARLLGPVCAVNSSHHQAVDAIGRGLNATAWSESGLVEALEHENLPVFSFQFHPERISYYRRRPDACDCASIFEHFIALCGGG
ncbi:putative glutamine amidotransferase [bioreactor metagenome]|uniref:Putative glutamine amidotransferase n=1 Tax=bioreactor metagenome TaxID=1076179 RepID=A0A644VUP8_9ZZZZ